MNIFELIFFAGLVVLVVFGSRVLGHLFGVTAWVFAVPLIVILVLALRWIGKRLKGRRMRNSMFDSNRKDDQK
jgi:hypothetical protein